MESKEVTFRRYDPHNRLFGTGLLWMKAVETCVEKFNYINERLRMGPVARMRMREKWAGTERKMAESSEESSRMQQDVLDAEREKALELKEIESAAIGKGLSHSDMDDLRNLRGKM